MATLRVIFLIRGRLYKLNGGEINAETLKKRYKETSTHEELLKSKQDTNVFYYDRSIFGASQKHAIAPSGTKEIIDSLGKLKSIF